LYGALTALTLDWLLHLSKGWMEDTLDLDLAGVGCEALFGNWDSRRVYLNITFDFVLLFSTTDDK